MEKKIILLISILLLSGCSVNYNLDIKEDGKYIEKITGTIMEKELDNDDRTDSNSFEYALNLATPLVRDQGEYIKNITDKGNYKEFEYVYVFDNNYMYSNVLNSCFSEVNFNDFDDYYEINLKGPFKCLYSDKININITSDYEILDNNARKIKGNNYVWTINDTNNSDINLVVSKNLLKENDKKNNSNIFRIVCLIIIVILSVLAILIYRKESKNDE